MSIITKCLYKASAWNNYLYSLKTEEKTVFFKIISGSWKGVKKTNNKSVVVIGENKVTLQPHS